jgi:hypothetical protein
MCCVLQEPGNLVLPPTHLQYKCKRDAGWGASIIVHEHYCNRVVFNTCGKNWVLIGLNFDDLGWPGIGILSAHLPLQKGKQMSGFRLFESVDANVELPNRLLQIQPEPRVCAPPPRPPRVPLHTSSPKSKPYFTLNVTYNSKFGLENVLYIYYIICMCS